jgi:hypothetical protein
MLPEEILGKFVGVNHLFSNASNQEQDNTIVKDYVVFFPFGQHHHQSSLPL